LNKSGNISGIIAINGDRCRELIKERSSGISETKGLVTSDLVSASISCSPCTSDGEIASSSGLSIDKVEIVDSRASIGGNSGSLSGRRAISDRAVACTVGGE